MVPGSTCSFRAQDGRISQQESILHELRIELNRRSLEICTHGEEGSASAPSAVVTLVSDDLDRVSIVPSRLRDEGVFSGRTIRLGSIPEDARALAVAQAVDEALRGVRPAPEPPPPTPAPPAPVAPAPPHEVAKPGQRVPDVEPPPQGHPSPVRLAVSLGPSLQWAPTQFTSASNTLAVPGAALRVAITSGCCGGSLVFSWPVRLT